MKMLGSVPDVRIAFLLVMTAGCAGMPVLAQRQCGPSQVPHVNRGIKGITVPDEPAHPDPPATDFHDSKYKLSFHVPAGWNFERKDGVLSDFRRDTRSAGRKLDVRGVASINYNPYPVSTFAGALFYYSVLPQATAASCAAQSSTGYVKSLPEIHVDGTLFQHGEDHHGDRCNETRDAVFTTFHGGACFRFDMVVNTFCAESSRMMQVSDTQLEDLQGRMAKILQSVRFSAQ